MKKYSFFLINPKQKYKHFAQQTELCKLLGKKILLTPLALPLIAALTPDHYKIRIIDEELLDDETSYMKPGDLPNECVLQVKRIK